ncbi:MAG: NAD-dependent epimerase/dehydratase family protein [Ruminococcaceae bacterium]|nr:NAD-dependent epimerase/dehydratase family protein [Oscillospiraceae bacterium]
MGKLYLITGAAGHLGTVLTQKLLARGDAVRALLLPGEEPLVPPRVQMVVGDVTDPASMEPFFRAEGYDAVSLIHCAAVVTIASGEDPAVWRVNVDGTDHVLRLAQQYGVSRVIYVSSVHAIPERPAPEIMAEPPQFSPGLVRGQYARSKAAATRLALQAAREGLNISVVHPSGIIGPGDIRGNNHTIRTLRAMAEGRIPVSIRGGYDFVDVRDVADGILQCEERGRAGECYILSSQYCTVRELLETVCRLQGRRPPRLVVPAFVAGWAAPVVEKLSRLTGRRPVLTPYSVEVLQTNGRYSHEKATRELGYRPRALTESIRDTLAERNVREKG